jgi:hypothetical protein
VGDDRQLWGEPRDVFGFFLDEAQRDKEREVRVLVAGGFEAPVQFPLQVLPERVAVGAMTMQPRTGA